MTQDDILKIKFDSSAKGTYKASDVQSHLKHVKEYCSTLLQKIDAAEKENEELKSKMDVLTQKIEEYKIDEDNIKVTLLSAQRLAKTIKEETKAECETLLVTTREKCEDAYNNAKQKAEQEINQLKSESEAYVANSVSKADEYLAKAEAEYNEKTQQADKTASEILHKAAKKAEYMLNEAKIRSTARAEAEYYSKTHQAEETANEILHKASNKAEYILSEARARYATAVEKANSIFAQLKKESAESVIEIQSEMTQLKRLAMNYRNELNVVIAKNTELIDRIPEPEPFYVTIDESVFDKLSAGIVENPFDEYANEVANEQEHRMSMRRNASAENQIDIYSNSDDVGQTENNDMENAGFGSNSIDQIFDMSKYFDGFAQYADNNENQSNSNPVPNNTETVNENSNNGVNDTKKSHGDSRVVKNNAEKEVSSKGIFRKKK